MVSVVSSAGCWARRNIQAEVPVYTIPNFNNLRRCKSGFSLIEMLVVVSVLLVMAAFVAPVIANSVTSISLHYAATDLSGLVQRARIEAARKNSYYAIRQTTLSTDEVGYFVDLSANRSGVFASGDPLVEMGGGISVHSGTGSGAPNEATLLAALRFTPNATGALPAFNARGLPCLVSAGACVQTPGQGFIYFLSKTTSLWGTNWAAVAVTPSARSQVWIYDGANWTQQ